MKTCLSIASVIVMLLLVPLVAQDYEIQLQRAIQQESIGGDLRAAIKEYERIAKAASDRAVKARALLRLADAHRNLGDAEAKRIYERIVSEYPDQRNESSAARTMLSTLSSSVARPTSPAARQIWVGADAMGSPSADGRYLSYTDWETGDLAVRDLVNNTSRRLTNTGGFVASGDYAEFSVISPDGRFIAYAWYSEKPAKGPAYDLRVVSTATSSTQPRILHRGEAQWVQPVAWTADARNVVFIRQLEDRTHDLAVVSVDGGSPRTLKVFGRACPLKVGLSPDGRYFTYDLPNEGRGQGWDIYTVPFTGGPETAIVQHSGNDQGPIWSPDGSHVLFVSDRTGARALWRQPVRNGRADGEPSLVTKDIGGVPLGVSLNGTVFYIKGGGTRDIYSATLDDRFKIVGFPVLLAERYINTNRSGMWSADGRQLAFYTTRGGGNSAPGTVSVMILRPETGEQLILPLNLTLAAGASAGLRWFPDGGSLLVVGRDIERGGNTFNRLDASSGRLELLHQTTFGGGISSHPVLSLDGKGIFFIDRPEGDDRHIIGRFDIGEKRVTELKTGPWFGSLALSPDGRTLAYIGVQPGAKAGTASIGVLSATGSDHRVLFEALWSDTSRVGSLAWTQDGTHILFARKESDGRQQIWSLSSNGGAPEPTGLIVKGQAKMLNFHPDGKRLAYTAVAATPAELWVLEHVIPAAVPAK